MTSTCVNCTCMSCGHLFTEHDDISVLGVAILYDLVLKPVVVSHDGVLVTSKRTEPSPLYVDVTYANVADGNHGGGKLAIQVKDRLQERTQRDKAWTGGENEVSDRADVMTSIEREHELIEGIVKKGVVLALEVL